MSSEISRSETSIDKSRPLSEGEHVIILEKRELCVACDKFVEKKGKASYQIQPVPEQVPGNGKLRVKYEYETRYKHYPQCPIDPQGDLFQK